ncbi:hypothetical protein BGZ61DRAFT_374747 [Ilyonectria robusta]|uniref:uncharacterized protein n=1 Tax=Ilyonectria robusta TaxID=1079257 RepID=UPI001E8EA6BE|nr:uncharacterized protein BGZ61DRAFT_374747 [Ilyonectria robusta]KAH8652588.1 hypothetical protein BGZ61DRAFT_374747 [Ilyonectria robusta]
MSDTNPAATPSGDEPREEKHKTKSAEVAPETLQNPYFINANRTSRPRRKLPPWLDHFNAKDLKRLLRCSLAMWIMTIFIYINPIQNEMGQASFLGCIVLWLAPPSGTVFMHLVAAITVMLGVTTAWAWGLITMKAALATRSDADTQSRLAELQQMAVSQNASDSITFVKIKLYNGFMLHTSVTAIYFCMICLYLYLIARLRVAAPKLRLTQMMGCIVSAVFLTQAPLLPSFNGNVARPLVLPCAIAEGIALVCSILIFPTSSASEALDLFKDLLAPMPAFLDACLLGLKHPGLRMSTETLTGAKLKLLTAWMRVNPITTFLPIDFSIGRWSSDDMIKLIEPLRLLTVEFTSLLEIHRQAEVHKDRSRQAMAVFPTTDNIQDSQTVFETGRHQLNREAYFHMTSNSLGKAEQAGQSLQVSSDPAQYLIEACKESLKAIIEALLNANAFKESPSHADMLEKHSAALERLRAQLEAFKASTSGSFLKSPYSIFNDDGFLKVDSSTFPGLTHLMMGLLVQERLSQLADALEQLLSRIIELETIRTSQRLWLPTRLASLFGWMSTTEYSEDTPAADIGDAVTTRISPASSAYARPPGRSHAHQDIKSSRAELASMRTPNSRRRSRVSQVLLDTAHWLGNAEGTFAIRMAIMSIALSIPAVIPPSAGFFYRENGLWAVIMAQLTLLPYTADVVYGIVVRVIGTIVGGIVGMAAWYIGSGSGSGSPYGEAAIMAFVIVIFMWWRLFSSPALMPAGIMMGITAYLVAIYSWIDMHEEPYGNPGRGYEVFWRRLVLVLVGLSATFIANFIPKPPSANHHYRGLLSDSLVSIRDQYALFASNWKDPATDLRNVAEEEVLAALEALLSASGPIQLTVFEFSTSNFDTDTLSQVCQLCMLLHQAIAQLLVYTTRLSKTQRSWIITSTGATEEDVIAEIMAVLTVVQQALQTDDALPAILPTPLFAKAIEFAREHLQEGVGGSGVHGRDDVDDEGLRRYVVMLNAFLQMLAALDELVLVIKRVVGETSNIAMLEVRGKLEA